MARTGAGMTGGDGYLSRDREHLAGLQRERRVRMVRIDYMPGRGALAIFQARKARERPNSVAGTNSAVLDAILVEWAQLTGIKCSEESKPMSTDEGPEFPYRSAQARMTSEAMPAWMLAIFSRPPAKPAPKRVRCGAKRHRDGEPCQALSEPGKRRCRFHGGRSTGPRTPEGKARALANLRQGSQPTVDPLQP